MNEDYSSLVEELHQLRSENAELKKQLSFFIKPELLQEAKAMYLRGEKLQAIKLLKNEEIMIFGLKFSRDFLEAVTENTDSV